jgi:phosphatidylglycerophosphate synthase
MNRLLKWLYQNSANLLSASRVLTPLILFGAGRLSIREKVIAIVILAATDLFDGPLARRIKNADGVGKFVDSFSDKVMILSVLGFFLWEKIIDPRIIGLIILGELLPFSIACFGVGLAWRKKAKKELSQTVKIVLEHWSINAPGKLTMVFYFSMGVFIALSIIFPQNEILVYIYLVSFGGGLIFRFISIGYYIVDLNNWQREYNSKL